MFDQGDKILTEAVGARQTSERLLPLLSLLAEEVGQSSPLDELKGLLQAILEIVGSQQKTLQRIESAYATASQHSR